MHPMTKATAMTATAKRKDHPLSMRLPEGDIAIIDRAATRLPAFPGHEPPRQPFVLEIRTPKSAQISTGRP